MHRTILAALLAVVTLGATAGAGQAQGCSLYGCGSGGQAGGSIGAQSACSLLCGSSSPVSGGIGGASPIVAPPPPVFTPYTETPAYQREQAERIESQQRALDRRLSTLEQLRESCRGLSGGLLAGILGC